MKQSAEEGESGTLRPGGRVSLARHNCSYLQNHRRDSALIDKSLHKKIRAYLSASEFSVK